jgi:hypothetical protein
MLEPEEWSGRSRGNDRSGSVCACVDALEHAQVILDEAQNTTTEQMSGSLTRIGFPSAS